MSEAKVPDYDTCGLFHRLHCIKTLASRPVLICKSYYFFARKEAAGILSYSQFRFFVYFTFLFKLLGGEIYLAVSWYTFMHFILHIHLISHFCVPHLKFLEPKWSHVLLTNIYLLKLLAKSYRMLF